MGVYPRGNVLWLRFQDATGKWRDISSGYRLGHEALAEEMLAIMERELAQERATNLLGGKVRLTIAAYAAKWLEQRDTHSIEDERGHLYNHIVPELGEIALDDLGPKRVRAFVELLRKKKKLGNLRKDGTRVPTDELLAPRTVRHVYGTLRNMLNDAVADEIIKTNPCVLKDELPAKKDKDGSWRRTAVFTRDEVETIISAPVDKIPEDRRVLDALIFVGAMRFGEAAALTWRDYDAVCEPLGKLVIDKSYSSKTREVKATKTENPREMPVHPTLAKILAEWKLSGFERLTGRKPEPDDLIVPSRRGKPRNVNHMLRKFHADLERLGLRVRRQHDGRRTFISLARAAGAGELLRWATHGPTGDIMDQYTTPPWAALCDEVAKLRVSVREGQVIELEIHQAAGAETLAADLAAVSQVTETAALSRGADGTRSGGRYRSVTHSSVTTRSRAQLSIVTDSQRSVADLREVDRSPDPIADELDGIRDRWTRARDQRALRRELLKLLAGLE